MKYLEEWGIDIGNCRGQFYDSDMPNISGKYQGMEELILKLNIYAAFIPCCAHSLNLVKKQLFILKGADFFKFIQEFFVY